MATKKTMYFKTFGLFLLLAASGGVVVSIINYYLNMNGMASQTTQYVLWLVLMAYFFGLCRRLFKKIDTLEKHQP